MTDKVAQSGMTTGQRPADAEHVGSGSGMIAIAMLAILAILGLLIVARAEEGAFQFFGTSLTGFSILFLFRVIALLLPARSSEI